MLAQIYTWAWVKEEVAVYVRSTRDFALWQRMWYSWLVRWPI